MCLARSAGRNPFSPFRTTSRCRTQSFQSGSRPKTPHSAWARTMRVMKALRHEVAYLAFKPFYVTHCKTIRY
jgi:hypothetical protein